ncbi:MAG: dTDP-4-dehydrorhamnose 3,5-epimerase [Actinomycetota bacterium]|jgi:dTDP-4-dehydrorhamnose 3,5-epimerase
MSVQELSIGGACVVTHRVFPDERGIFREWFKAAEMTSIDRNFSVQQANYSKSNQGVIRGIHYSLAPQGQAKVVTCASGKIVDLLIDLRPSSSSYLKVEYVELSEDSGKVVYIPTGVGHGFLTLSECSSVVYLTSSRHAPQYEMGINPLDPGLALSWPASGVGVPILSKNDREAPSLAEAKRLGILPTF